MQRQYSQLTFLALCVILAALLASCGILGKKWGGINGRVLHEIHDDPMEGAIVLGLWKGEVPGNKGKWVCYHVESTTADAKGYFEIPNWREPNSYKHLKNRTIHIVAYKDSYRTSELTSEIVSKKNYTYYLANMLPAEDEEEERKERLKYLQNLIGKSSCDLQGKSRVNLKPMYDAIVVEAEDIMKSAQDREIVQKLKSWQQFVAAPPEKK